MECEKFLKQPSDVQNEAPRPQGGASRARSGEQDASKENFAHIVPLNPAYSASAGGGMVRSKQ
jgi:hypothetical protein